MRILGDVGTFSGRIRNQREKAVSRIDFSDFDFAQKYSFLFFPDVESSFFDDLGAALSSDAESAREGGI